MQMSIYSWGIAALLAVLLSGLSFSRTMLQDSVGLESAVPEIAFVPDDNSVFAAQEPEWFVQKRIFLPRDQSNWQCLEPTFREPLTRIVVRGFGQWNRGTDISAEIDDARLLQKMDEVFIYGRSFRPAIGDCHPRFNYSFHNVSFGRLELTFGMGDTVIIGVGARGFVLGQETGSERQTFYNQRMAWLLKDILTTKFDVSYPEESFSGLLGEVYFEPAREKSSQGDNLKSDEEGQESKD
jgi:hypothetical protein